MGASRDRSRSTATGTLVALAVALLLPATSLVAPAAAQHLAEVTCDAEVEVGDDGEVVYQLTPGEPLRCAATGWAEGLEVLWSASLFAEEGVGPFDEQGGSAVVVDGAAPFEIQVPERRRLGWLSARVERGDTVVALSGSTAWYHRREMTCSPDPAQPGDEVACAAAVPAGEGFWWSADLRDARGRYLDGAEGQGTVGSDGLGRFTFAVPAGPGIASYEAMADHEDGVAEYEGEVSRGGASRLAPIVPLVLVALGAVATLVGRGRRREGGGEPERGVEPLTHGLQDRRSAN